MADIPQTLSLITLAQQYRGDVVRQINRRTVFLKMVKIVPGEGKNVAWAPEADGQIAENYSEGADATNFGSDAQASAILSWGLYRGNIHVTKLAMDTAKTSGTPMGNRMLWARNLVNASAKLATVLNKDCFSGAGTGTLIFGLDGAIATDNNTYAGIDRTVGANAYWKPTKIDPGVLTAPTFALIRDDIRQIYEACGENPDLALCQPAVFNKVGSLFDATRRQIDEIMTARGKIRLDFGYQALEVDGMMFVKDKDATANRIYYINTDHLELQYLPDSNMSGLPQFEVEADDGFGQVPLGMTYEMLAKNGPSERAEVLATIQLVVNRPDACGARLNVSTT
jgi:hypothetical protein